MITGRDVFIASGVLGMTGGGLWIHPGVGLLAFGLVMYVLGVFYRRR